MVSPEPGHEQTPPGADPSKFGLPHDLTATSAGDVYVVEWVADGRVRKLRKA